jgi:CBS domain-containing membrane protein
MKSRKPNSGSFYGPTVQDLMTRRPVCLSGESTVKDLAQLMKTRGIRHVPITDGNSVLIGLVTHRDFLSIAVSKLAECPAEELDELYSSLKIKDVMGRKVTSASVDTPLEEAAAIMYRNKFGCLPVVENGKLVGILTEADFVKAFIEREAQFKEA